MNRLLLTVLALVFASSLVQAQDKAVPVTADNFVRAESNLYFGAVVKKDGFGKFEHDRAPAPIDQQTVIRMNRDTLYSGAVFDLGAGPATVTLPDSGRRFMSAQVIDEDEYSPMVVYRPGSFTLTRDKIGTRYVLVAVRTLVNPADPKDVDKVHALQDAIKVSQKSAGKFDVPKWDPASQKKVRDALLSLSETLPDSRGMFGTKGQTNPVRHLIGAASAWGGNPEKDARYLLVTPPENNSTNPRKPRTGARIRRQRRLGDGPIRRLRRQDTKLSAHCAGLELHCTSLSTACRNPERQVEVSRSSACGITPASGHNRISENVCSRPERCRE